MFASTVGFSFLFRGFVVVVFSTSGADDWVGAIGGYSMWSSGHSESRLLKEEMSLGKMNIAILHVNQFLKFCLWFESLDFFEDGCVG